LLIQAKSSSFVLYGSVGPDGIRLVVICPKLAPRAGRQAAMTSLCSMHLLDGGATSN